MAANKNGDASAASGANSRLHFSVSLDMALLREVLAENPFRDPSQWHHVARNLQESAGKTVTARSARERIDLLLSHYASEVRANLRKSGTENEYNEREHLLQEVLDLAREFAYKVRARKKKHHLGNGQQDAWPMKQGAPLLRDMQEPHTPLDPVPSRNHQWHCFQK
ncbi:hypothetical protein MTO96_029862 [Rhipicephalus appendiculatus]